jgi:hypothetical protein
MWKNTDPRFDIGKRARVVVIRPDCDGLTAFVAQVETKHSWAIFPICTSMKDFYIDVDDDWDESWWWAMGPPEA